MKIIIVDAETIGIQRIIEKSVKKITEVKDIAYQASMRGRAEIFRAATLKIGEGALPLLGRGWIPI